MSATATLEEEIRQLKQDEIAAYKMPRPSIGQSVLWYPSGTKETTAETTFVLEAKARTIVIQRASGVCEASVRHLDDPKLQLSIEQRAAGAWDFTDYDKRNVAQSKTLETLEARVAALEKKLKDK